MKPNKTAVKYQARHGIAICQAVARAAGSNYPYWYQICVGLRTPSAQKAKRWVKASVRLTPDAPLDLHGLMRLDE